MGFVANLKAARKAFNPANGRAIYQAPEPKRVTFKESAATVEKMTVTENPHELFDRKGLGIVDTMMCDEHVGTYVVMKRTFALASGAKFEPASDEPQHVEHADFLNHDIERMDGRLHNKLEQMLTAIEYGYSVTNRVRYLLPDGPFAGKIGVRALKTKPPHNFCFDTDGFGNLKPNGILFTNPTDYQVEHLPASEFIIYTYKSPFGSLYGFSDLLRAYDRWNSKRWVDKFDDVYLERFATGVIKMQYPSPLIRIPTTDEFDTAMKLGDNKSIRASIIMPDDWTIDLHEPTGQGSDTFEKAIDRRGIAIARAILIPDLLGFSRAPAGTQALGVKHFDLFVDGILGSLRGDVKEEIMEEGYAKPQIDLNYGPQEMYPKFVFDPLTFEQIVRFLGMIYSGIDKGAITPDLDIQNKVRRVLEIAEKEKEDETKAGGSPPGRQAPAPPTDDDDDDTEPPAFALQPAEAQRELTVFELKVDIPGIAATVNQLHDQLISSWSDTFLLARRSLISFLRRNNVVSEGNMQLLSDIKFPHKRDLTDSLQGFMVSSVYEGALQGQREINRARSGNFEMPADKFLSPAQFDEIEGIFRARGLNVTPAIKEASALAKRQAFFITDVETEKVLAKAKAIVNGGIRRADQNWTERELKRLFAGYTESVEISGLATAARVEVIARNNFTTAFNDGRRAWFEDPDVEDFVVAYQWSSVLDDATTVHCNVMDQRVLSKEDLNDHGWPPAHHNCRAIIVPVTEAEQTEDRPLKLQDIPKRAVRGVGFEMEELVA